VIVCTPSVIGEKHDGSNKLDRKLDEYSEISRKVAKETKSQLCDLRKAFLEKLKTDNKDNKGQDILTGDGVHLNDAGNRPCRRRHAQEPGRIMSSLLPFSREPLASALARGSRLNGRGRAMDIPHGVYQVNTRQSRPRTSRPSSASPGREKQAVLPLAHDVPIVGDEHDHDKQRRRQKAIDHRGPEQGLDRRNTQEVDEQGDDGTSAMTR